MCRYAVVAQGPLESVYQVLHIERRPCKETVISFAPLADDGYSGCELEDALPPRSPDQYRRVAQFDTKMFRHGASNWQSSGTGLHNDSGNVIARVFPRSADRVLTYTLVDSSR